MPSTRQKHDPLLVKNLIVISRYSKYRLLLRVVANGC